MSLVEALYDKGQGKMAGIKVDHFQTNQPSKPCLNDAQEHYHAETRLGTLVNSSANLKVKALKTTVYFKPCSNCGEGSSIGQMISFPHSFT